jgi:rhodanese-related sulfurtransferase
MKRISLKLREALGLFFFFVCLLSVTVLFAAGNPPISGKVIGGYRLLPIAKTSDTLHFTVYRGDYIKFNFDDSIPDPVLIITDLAVEEKLPTSLDEAPYFKMKKPGSLAFSLGRMSGRIDVIEYQQPNYQEVTAKEASQRIENTRPLVLDVRTPFEYQRGHLEDSVLIPVQELQSRLGEISEYKNQDILIYCATGNRSTVASKILIDSGFKRILNLRRGIVGWGGSGYPVVR